MVTDVMATFTTKLAYSILLTRFNRFALVSLKMRLASLRFARLSLRGGGAICFGHRAVTNFLQQHGYSYIMRAHEAHAEGVAVSKGARVFTVFSTSKDHNQVSERAEMATTTPTHPLPKLTQ